MADEKQVELVGIDAYSGDSFVLYFSDETYTRVSADDLVDCFPDRQPIPAQSNDESSETDAPPAPDR